MEHPVDAAEFCSRNLNVLLTASVGSELADVNSGSAQIPANAASDPDGTGTDTDAVPAIDFSVYIGSSKLSDKQKFDAIKHRWHPAH